MQRHRNYPHQEGRLPGCLACEMSCFCDFKAIEAGREVECIFIGHTENQGNLRNLTDVELDEAREEAAAVTHDAELLDRAVRQEQKRRKRENRA